MDFQALAQETRRLSGVGGTGPANVEVATGMELKIVNYVQNAWRDIQTHPKNWKWMWEDYSVDLQPGPGTQPLQTILNTREYQLVDCDKIRVDTFRSYLTATGVSDRQRLGVLHQHQAGGKVVAYPALDVVRRQELPLLQGESLLHFVEGAILHLHFGDQFL